MMSILGILLLVAAAGLFAASMSMVRSDDPAKRRSANTTRAIAAGAVLASILVLIFPLLMR